MGTRFLATKECPVHDLLKDRIIEASESDTMLVMESLKNPARVIRNAWSEKIHEMERGGATLEELAPMISGHTSRKGWAEGTHEEGMFPAGQAIGRITDKPHVEDLVKTIVLEAAEVRERFIRMH
jgi:nitronate monooxygenase